jgi:hypothetical protein
MASTMKRVLARWRRSTRRDDGPIARPWLQCRESPIARAALLDAA